jgi:ATP-dependent DNA helicase RecQ
LRLGADCGPVLKGQRAVELRKNERGRKRFTVGAPDDRDDAPQASVHEDSAAEGPFLPPMDADLFQALRALRLRLATEQGVPPYVIFHDTTLRAMASLRPATLWGMGRIPGVGVAKLERYGKAFLDEVAKAGGASR